MEESSTTDVDRCLLLGDALRLKELETSLSDVHHVLTQTRQKFNKVHVSIIQKFYDQLVSNMTRTKELADGLYTKEFISKQDHETIICSSDLYIANKRLLNLIKATDVYNYFLQQLKETRQNHIYQLLSTSGYDISKEHVKPIRIHYIQLTEKMDVDSGLLSELYANNIISSVERQSIQSEQDPYNRRQRLLSLIVMKSTEDYHGFVEALGRTGQRHLVALLNTRSKCLIEDGKSSHIINFSTKHNLSVSHCNRQPRLGQAPPPPTLPKPRLELSCHKFLKTSDSYSFNSAIKPMGSSLLQGRRTHIPQNNLQKNPKMQKQVMGLNTDELLDKLDIHLNSLIYTKVALRLRQLHLVLPDSLAVKLKERNKLILALDREERIFVEGILHFVSTEHQLAVETRKLKCLQKLNQKLDTHKIQLEEKYSVLCNECNIVQKKLMKSDEKIRALQMQLEEEQRKNLNKTNELELLKGELKTLLSDKQVMRDDLSQLELLKGELKTLLSEKQEMQDDLSQLNKEMEELKITLNHTIEDHEKLKVDMEVMRGENLKLLNDLKQASNETEEMVKKVEASRLETSTLKDEQRDSLQKKEEIIHQLTREVAIKQETINELIAANTGFNEMETNTGKIENDLQRPLGVPPRLQAKQIINTLRAELAATKENYDVLMKEKQKQVEEIKEGKEKCKTVEEKYSKPNEAIEPVHSTLFLSKSTVVRVIPGAGKGDVYGIAVLRSELFIARHGATSIEVYDTNNITTTPRLLKIADKTLNCPRLAACSHYNCLYVSRWSYTELYCDIREPVMYRVELSNSSVSNWRVTPYAVDHISLTNDDMVLVTSSRRQIGEYTTHGELIREIRLDRSINSPRHCIQLSDGNFVICHDGSKPHRVCIVDASGRIIKSYGGSPGSGVEQLNYSFRLSVDKYDHIFVTDFNNNRVLLLSPTLTFLGRVQIPGHQLNSPIALHFDNINHRLYVDRRSDVLVVELSDE